MNKPIFVNKYMQKVSKISKMVMERKVQHGKNSLEVYHQPPRKQIH